MIETDFYILDGKQYQEYYTIAQELGITLDHYLLEWCDVEGPDVYVD